MGNCAFCLNFAICTQSTESFIYDHRIVKNKRKFFIANFLRSKFSFKTIIDTHWCNPFICLRSFCITFKLMFVCKRIHEFGFVCVCVFSWLWLAQRFEFFRFYIWSVFHFVPYQPYVKIENKILIYSFAQNPMVHVLPALLLYIYISSVENSFSISDWRTRYKIQRKQNAAIISCAIKVEESSIAY